MTFSDWQSMAGMALSGPVSILVIKFFTERKARQEAARLEAAKDGMTATTRFREAELGALPTMMQRIKELEAEARAAERRTDRMQAHLVTMYLDYSRAVHRAEFADAVILQTNPAWKPHSLLLHESIPSFDDK